MFVHYNGKIVNYDIIESVDYGALAILGSVLVHYKNKINEPVEGADAFNLVMDLCPEALEGEGLKYRRHAWSVHNIIGHPLMQICAWLGLSKLGLKIHDATVPHPINK